mmetsp:Transcript_40347/g.48902  ORF Transcript_40347/g.48902 Transcript_40347/m.48902 type:complete len:604 (+) Transcript_40347:132-1943(+)|eukprot:CAMPEP_0197848842 /NCGR_PEP_ID=MMETSP1438-20131217/10208_1 /TAXON_ID=1461541 /ORGANISM="Pterosperma sp., Strain CCMP1384" /LENGTH=603 /DNA_ID=CAMNT_0043461271 /DNA_START=130 /DNA_END=1941 /DNA_ORIENTATION=-
MARQSLALCLLAALVGVVAARFPGAGMTRFPMLTNPSTSSFNTAPLRSNQGNAGAYIDQLTCKLDSKVNASSLRDFCDNHQFVTPYFNLWDSYCSTNRGVFVTDPADGETYSCGDLPSDWPASSGTIAAVCDKNTPPEDAVKLLDLWIGAVFNATITKVEESCDMGTIGVLSCPEREAPLWKTAADSLPWSKKLNGKPIRAVNVGGLFVLEPWITPGLADWDTEIRDESTFSLHVSDAASKLNTHRTTFYNEQDFKDMATAGLNAIRLPVGWWYFVTADQAKPFIQPSQKLTDADHPITKVIQWAKDAGLQVLLDLHGAPGSQNGLDNSGVKSMDPQVENWGETWIYDENNVKLTVQINVAMADYLAQIEKNLGLDNILGLELVNEPWVFMDMSRVRDFYVQSINAIRAKHADLPIFIHDAFRHIEWQWLLKNFPAHNVFFDTHLYHAFNTADIASNTVKLDKLKMTAHEDISCRYGSLLRWKSCTGVPAFTGEWSLAIDDCMGYIRTSSKNATQFQDFGQCKHLKDRVGDPWWDAHIKSFAMRQIAMFEREIGWAFWTYKLDETAEQDISAPLWAFHLAVKKGYIDTTYPTNACDRVPDYTL